MRGWQQHCSSSCQTAEAMDLRSGRQYTQRAMKFSELVRRLERKGFRLVKEKRAV